MMFKSCDYPEFCYGCLVGVPHRPHQITAEEMAECLSQNAEVAVYKGAATAGQKLIYAIEQNGDTPE